MLLDCFRYHGFKESDLDRTLNLLGTSTGGNTGYLDILGSERPSITLRQVLANLKRTYCSSLGVEYMHIPSQEKCNWIRDQVEHPKWMKFTKVSCPALPFHILSYPILSYPHMATGEARAYL